MRTPPTWARTSVALARWSLRGAEEALASCTVAHLTPAMLAGLLERDLGQLRTVVCAGAALPHAVRERAKSAGVHVVDYYGAAELSFVAMRVGSRLDPFPEVEVDLRDGVIWARSPWLADGYAPGQSGPMIRDAEGWATVGRPWAARRRARTHRPRSGRRHRDDRRRDGAVR